MFGPFSGIKLEGNVDAIDLGNSTVTVLGVTAVVDNLTQRTDENSDPVKTFGLVDISIGDWVEIRGFVGAGNTLIATKLERHEQKPAVEIQGPAKDPNPDGGTVAILGVTISLQVDSNIKDADDNPLTAGEFFSAIEPGVTIIAVKGTVIGTKMVSAAEVRLTNI